MIGDARGFSGKTPITPSRSFSVETLTGVTPSWKTELNRSISVMEDRIPRGLQHHHETCCKKGSRHRRQACMVQRWHHHGDVVFRTGGLVYDSIPPLGLSLQSPIEFIQSPIRFIRESRDGT